MVIVALVLVLVVVLVLGVLVVLVVLLVVVLVGNVDTEEATPSLRTPGDDSPSDKVVRRPVVARQASKEIIEGIRRKRSTSIVSSHDDDAQDKIDAEEARWRIPASFFYDPSTPELNPPLEDRELPRQGARAARFMGFDFSRINNAVWTSNEEFAYITGHVVCFMNIHTRQRRFLHGRDNGGIGAVAMSPDMTYFAVAERSITSQPNVYIYSFKTMRLYRILRKGTMRGYASVAFSPHNKNHLAALGCAPDYLLSVWDWRNERLLLKCKAYGQDVFSIRWGQFPGMLTSVGVGHIRFWKMATTFTGLKLQGALGKFGASELSDISGFVELPDGKVVSGTEYGKLLVWEGVFVKVELMRAKDGLTAQEAATNLAGSPHAGAIDVILIDKDNGLVISGGDDGYLRWWPIEEIDSAEADYDNGILEYGIRMHKEVCIPASTDQHIYPAHIQHVTVCPDGETWLVQDSRNGMVWLYDITSANCQMVFSCHSKQVTGTVVSSSYSGLVVSCGMDGTVRAFNVSQAWDNELFRDPRPLANAGVGATCMDATPELVDPSKRTLCVGYTDGTIRAFTACADGFLQLQALKPHKCMVKQLKYSGEDAGLMATLGEDNSVFFFQVQMLSEHAIPVGFVSIPATVNFFAWDDISGNVLLSLGDGSLLVLKSPIPESVDNTESYDISVNYISVMPDVPEIEECGTQSEEDEGGEGGEEGEASPTAGEEKEEKAKDDDEDGEAHKEVIVTSVSRAIYIPGEGSSDESERRIIFTGTGKYTGGLWECSLFGIQETIASEVPLSERISTQLSCMLRAKLPKNVNVTHLSLSPGGNWIILGFADGRIWLIPRIAGGCFLCANISDGSSGAVNSVQMMDDESMMVVAAGDGSLVMLLISEGLLAVAHDKAEGVEVNMEEVGEQLQGSIPELPETTMEGWGLPPKEAPGVVAINPDITDPQQYSIQDAKLKAEEDSAKAAAELKKLRREPGCVRERVSEIREELVELQVKNSQLVEAQLVGGDMVVDQEYINHLKEDMENQIEQVRFELAWSVEFHERGLQKLKDYYLKRVDFERVEVLGFQSPHRVSTFRCATMSDELQANLARLHELIFAAEGDADLEEEDDENEGMGYEGAKTEFGFDVTDMSGSQNAERTLSGAEMRELRRQQRLQRKAQIQELERAKPNEQYEAPEDVEAIANAEATLGNYMLKTSEDYQVPENQRMNAEKKRRQMFLLEESIHAIKTEFNQRVLALRDFRQQVRAEVERDLMALAEIDEQLGTKTDWVVGIVDSPLGAPPEFPEKRFEFNDADIQAFASHLKGEKLEEANPPAAEDHEDFQEEEEEFEPRSWSILPEAEEELYAEIEEDEGEDEEGGATEEVEAEGSTDMREGLGFRAVGVRPGAPLSGRAALAARRVGRLTLPQPQRGDKSGKRDVLSEAVATESQARLRHDKGQLEEHVRQVIDTFNMAVASIEKEKAKLESDLKNADMKLLVLYEELLTLNDLEEKDEALLKKATKCRQDKTSIMHQIKECQDQLSEKKAEIEEWHTQEQNLQAEFTDLVGENSPFLSALLKVYKKKVKRSKRKKGGEEEEMDEDEEDEDDEGSDIESDEDEDMDDDDVGPPQGCDHQIYESVIDLRDKRLEMEDALQEIQKAVEGLKNTHKRLGEDEQRIDKEQRRTDAEIQQFQTDKQRKLNQVPIVFSLRLSQVQCLSSADQSDAQERLPPELGQQVVFTNEGLDRLMTRITELHQEIKEVKARHKQLQRDFRVRKKDKSVALQHIEDLHAKFQDIQMLKFGQIVDLDLIERSAPNKYVQELQEKVLQAEAEHRRRIADWEKRMEKQKKELTKITCDNTSLMEQIVSMGYSQMQLDAALNARIANVTVNDNEPLNELRRMVHGSG
ncbi:CFAP44 [Symbiodinium natans]|uniref:CFAP44 protein n=1 Tax=Symbiodinium natans TaxID=878477 RepID=A0A812J2B2_9DINO|nr:CFAP44 [Symbiodinium natans]